jgi:nucleoside-diphosphate-sugar epimerase
LEAAGISPVIGDITLPETLAALSPDFDWVVNCVSASGGGADEYRRVYLEGTRHLLQWLSGRPPQRLIYTGSTGVYGQNDGEWVTESSPTGPVSPTGEVLVETEQLLLNAAREERFPAVILRVAGIYGPGRGYWLRQFLSGEARLEGDGARVLNMIHRDDVAGAIQAALEQGRPGEVYHVVDDEPVTQKVCFEWLAERLNRPLPPSVPVAPEGTRKRGVTNKRISNQRLRTELQYQLRYPTFREGFAAELVRLQSESDRSQG